MMPVTTILQISALFKARIRRNGKCIVFNNILGLSYVEHMAKSLVMQVNFEDRLTGQTVSSLNIIYLTIIQ